MLFIAPHPTAVLIYIVILIVIIGGTSYIIWRRRQFANLHQETVGYKVRSGDNIQILAEKLSIDWRKLAKLNNLKPPYSLQQGQLIRVPRPRPNAQDNSTPKQG
jgi:LysM repeat protein